MVPITLVVGSTSLYMFKVDSYLGCFNLYFSTKKGVHFNGLNGVIVMIIHVKDVLVVLNFLEIRCLK